MKIPNPAYVAWFKIILFYGALLLGCIMAFSPSEMGLQPQLNDKLLHSGGFAVMAFLSHMAHPRVPIIRLIVGLSLFGIGIELIQAWLPYRDFSLWDWGADILGVVLYFQIISLPFMRVLRSKFVPD